MNQVLKKNTFEVVKLQKLLLPCLKNVYFCPFQDPKFLTGKVMEIYIISLNFQWFHVGLRRDCL